MKRLLTVFVLYLVANGPAPAADLMAVYQRALQNDPQLREAEATRLAALEAKPKSLSALLPELTGNGLVSKERDTGSSNTTQSVGLPPCGPGVPPPCSSTGTPSTILETFPVDGKVDTTTHRYTVQLKQSIFSWGNWVTLQRAD